jgi:hypothetical protein
MKPTRARVLLAAGLMALAGTATATVLAAGPASAASSPVVLVSCAGHGQVRPATYDIGCMPSQELAAGLRWTSWRSVAFGGGELKVNDCTPTCARGNYVSFPILTVLWRAAPWPKHAGREYFSRLTWIFTGKRPGHVPAAQTFTLPAVQP